MQACVCKKMVNLSEKILGTISSVFKKDHLVSTRIDSSLSYNEDVYDESFMNEDLFVKQTDEVNDYILELGSEKQSDLNIYRHALTVEERKFLGF